MDSKHYDPNKLRQIRELRGESVQLVADTLKLHRQTIYRAEWGKEVSYMLLAKLCDHYQIPVTNVLKAHPELETV
jgi:DNA-binding XRE family transcriptional regulator